MTAPGLSLTVQIRTMQKEDLEQVQAIDRNSFSLPWPTSAYNYELTNPMSLLWVAEIPVEAGTPKIVGMIVVWLIVDEAHIATLAVDTDYRGMGIGKILLATALMEAVRTGMREATLEVRSGNLAAQSLYQRFKFQIIGFRPRYYRDNSEDALIMTMNNLGTAYLDWLESGSWRPQVGTAVPKSTISGVEIFPSKE
jgi:[ribosomal protein S18]-alanine N-acetyltransferase